MEEYGPAPSRVKTRVTVVFIKLYISYLKVIPPLLLVMCVMLLASQILYRTVLSVPSTDVMLLVQQEEGVGSAQMTFLCVNLTAFSALRVNHRNVCMYCCQKKRLAMVASEVLIDKWGIQGVGSVTTEYFADDTRIALVCLRPLLP